MTWSKQEIGWKTFTTYNAEILLYMFQIYIYILYLYNVVLDTFTSFKELNIPPNANAKLSVKLQGEFLRSVKNK